MRTALTSEMWDAINGAWLELQDAWGNGTNDARGTAALPALRAGDLAALRRLGLPHHAAQRRLLVLAARRLHLERADNTARILDVKYHVLLPEDEHVGGPLDFYQWTSILRSVSAMTAYHWVYRETLKPWLIADLLILNNFAAAVARQLLRQSGAQPQPDRCRLRPPGRIPSATPAASATGWEDIRI